VYPLCSRELEDVKLAVVLTRQNRYINFNRYINDTLNSDR